MTGTYANSGQAGAVISGPRRESACGRRAEARRVRAAEDWNGSPSGRPTLIAPLSPDVGLL
jgi:hypothetical protein